MTRRMGWSRRVLVHQIEPEQVARLLKDLG